MPGNRFYEERGSNSRRSAPAALRNREPIAEILRDWLPSDGLVLEIASGTGEHVVHFAQAFPDLEWQPTDIDSDALDSIRAWSEAAALPNVHPPIRLDASDPDWPIDSADAVLSINMVHISPWSAATGLLGGSARLLKPGAPLILYGPWVTDAFATAPSNLAFDADLKRRDPAWGLRRVDDFTAEAIEHGFEFAEQRMMPANNLMLLFRRTA
jgi:cyclopropane fatty-acyl-phospholipid synthase-like methyltransferase